VRSERPSKKAALRRYNHPTAVEVQLKLLKGPRFQGGGTINSSHWFEVVKFSKSLFFQGFSKPEARRNSSYEIARRGEGDEPPVFTALYHLVLERVPGAQSGELLHAHG
jgi:hypothetical protein